MRCGGSLIGLMFLLTASDVCAQQRYAFVVGVENYDPEYFRNLDFAEEDATALAAQLENMGYSVTLMTSQQRNPQQKPTTPAKILRILDGVLQGIDSDDTLLISFSGHGVQFTDEEALEGGGKETWFVPEEGTLKSKKSLLPIVKEIISRVDKCKAERKLLLIDACRNEVLSPAGDKSAGKISLGSIHENARVVPKGMTVLFSCSSGQKSWETKELKHSVFSNFVLEYLSGKLSADLYTDRQADVSGLVDFVRRKTNQYVIKNISADGQYPKLVGENEQWPIGKVGPRAAFENSLDMSLRLVPAGKFQMGSPIGESGHTKSETQREVEITKEFYLGIHEVTVGQFRQFVNDTKRDVSKNTFGFNQETGRQEAGEQYTFENPGWESTDQHPASCISWQDAIAFCRWLSKKEGRTYRLPTEAEWEYACRAGTSSAFNFGNANVIEFENLADTSDWRDEQESKDGFKFAAPVGSFKANEFGLFDMHGNVLEWCSDFWALDYFAESPKQDPAGPTDGKRRLLKGGSFQTLGKAARSANRIPGRSDDRHFAMGFRVVCETD